MLRRDNRGHRWGKAAHDGTDIAMSLHNVWNMIQMKGKDHLIYLISTPLMLQQDEEHEILRHWLALLSSIQRERKILQRLMGKHIFSMIIVLLPCISLDYYLNLLLVASLVYGYRVFMY